MAVVFHQEEAAETGAEAPAAAVETTTTPAASTQDASPRPDGLPEGFESIADLARAYQELQASTQGRDENAPAEQGDVQSQEAVSEALQAQGLDLDKFSASYFKNGGKLTDNDYTELSKAGFNRQHVDAIIAGQVAIEQAEEGALYDSVGGRDEFQKVSQWARANLTKPEIEAYNAALDSPDIPLEAAQLMVAGLRARYSAANGTEPTLIGGSSGSPNTPAAFQSHSQVTDAMRDPRYAKDEAYRREVEERLRNSNVFGR